MDQAVRNNELRHAMLHEHAYAVSVDVWRQRIRNIAALNTFLEAAAQDPELHPNIRKYIDLERWLTACRTCGVDPDFYATRERTKDEVLPWSHISVGVRPAYFWREREQAYKSVITPDCRVQCMGCGADRLLECGKCDEALTRRERAERGEV